jgi:hypothetical protein
LLKRTTSLPLDNKKELYAALVKPDVMRVVCDANQYKECRFGMVFRRVPTTCFFLSYKNKLFAAPAEC